VPGKRMLRLAAALAVSALLLVAIVFAFNLGRGRTPLGGEPEPDPQATPSAQPIRGVAATDFDPEGSPPEENADLAPAAVDGDPDTAWPTERYDQDLGPGGLKNGVGLLLDLGEQREVRGMAVRLVGQPTAIRVYVAARRPASVDQLTPAGSWTARERLQVDFEEPAEGRWVVLWLTSLPPVDGGFRAEVAQVVVRG
jgi:hypothetical protein